MSQSHLPPSETSPLLRSADSIISYDGEDDLTSPSSPVDFTPFNKVSKTDLAWVLAGLWSAVFLGALDGTCRYANILTYYRFDALSRHHRRYPPRTHRELFQRVQPVFIHRNIVFAFRMLLYSPVWYVHLSAQIGIYS